jgi:hypothetical protein
MLRIRLKGQPTIKVVIEREFEMDDFGAAIASVKSQVTEGLDLLGVVAKDFDEVKVDNQGALHCKNLPSTPESDDDERG